MPGVMRSRSHYETFLQFRGKVDGNAAGRGVIAHAFVTTEMPNGHSW